MRTILIVDDDLELCGLLSDYLRREDFEVQLAHDADAALAHFSRDQHPPDLVILDVMMPGKDGLTALRELRQKHHLPVIILSARGDPADRVVGLELGADDYLSKPFLPRELLARVRALLRRGSAGSDEPINIGLLRLQPSERRAWVGDVELKLTGAEYSLLLALARQAGNVVNKAALTEEGLGRPIERFDRSVDVHVSRLRRKLSTASPLAPGIESVRGSGYLMTRPST